MTTTAQTTPGHLTAGHTTAPAPSHARSVMTCCRRAMSGIEVTARGVTLVLHSCTSCGRHDWERDGVRADRAELLEGVKTFLEQPRIATPRRRRAR